MNDFSRRGFLAASAGVVSALPPNLFGARVEAPLSSLAAEIGITTSSVARHLSAAPQGDQFTLLELPRIMREELDMRVIDLNTSSLASLEPAYLDQVHAVADKHGCILTNLKMNYPGIDMGSPDVDTRRRALTDYKRAIDAGKKLGVRWARPLPLRDRPDMTHYVASFRELADYAQEHEIGLVVENYGWMDTDPDSVPKLVAAVDRNLAVSPDTGNWANDEIRFAGLAKAFPLAVTCDFKAGELGQNGEHPRYDLQRCFQIGWDAGFRGPWCLEHANVNKKELFRDLGMLRDMLRRWMAMKG